MSDAGGQGGEGELVLEHQVRTITALRPANAGERLKVYVEGQHVATVDSLKAHELDLRIGRELSDADLDAIERAGQMGRAREMALRWLAVRARSRAEIERRLIARKINRDVARATVERLADADLVDDEVYATSRMAALRQKGAGPRLIEHKLREMGVGRELIERVVRTEFEHADQDREAIELARKRLGRSLGSGKSGLQGEGDVRTISRRLGAFLARRGYGPQTCARAVEAAMREACPETEQQAED